MGISDFIAVLNGVIANAVTSLFGFTASNWVTRRKGTLDTMLEVVAKKGYSKALIARLSRGLDLGPGTLVRLREAGPELTAMTQKLLAARFAGANEATVERIRGELTVCVALATGWATAEVDDLVRPTFEALDRACNAIVSSDRSNQLLLGDDWTLMSSELVGIHESELGDPSYAVERELKRLSLDFASALALYTNAVEQRHANILSQQAGTRADIDVLYVNQNLVAAGTRVSIQELLGVTPRLVILGDPGAGKSTLTRWLIHHWSEATRGTRPSAAPMPVNLREYAVDRQTRGISLVEHMLENISKRYQIQGLASTISHALNVGRAYCLFDGLDEVTDPHLRREIAEDIASFSRLHPATPIVVTSRVVGYDFNRLPNDLFSSVRLPSFTDPQVGDYAVGWFAFNLGKERDDPEVVEKQRDFLRESEEAKDLRSNPLILSLLCSIYRRKGQIPRTRATVYERCAELMLEDWDRSRGIESGPIPSYRPYLESTVEAVARLIYEDAALAEGVSKTQLKAYCESHLGKMMGQDDVARSAARDLLEHLTGRAWVFSDFSHADDGEPVYRFTHRTFMEFYAARQLVRAGASVEETLSAIVRWIDEQLGEVAPLLGLQLLATRHEGASDDLLNFLRQACADADDPDQHLARLQTLMQSLGFLTPSLPALESAVTHLFQTLPRLAPETRDSLIQQLLASSGPPTELLRSALMAALESTISLDASLGLDLIEEFSFFTDASVEGLYPYLTSAHISELSDLVTASPHRSAIAFRANALEIDELLDQHGQAPLWLALSRPISHREAPPVVIGLLDLVGSLQTPPETRASASAAIRSLGGWLIAGARVEPPASWSDEILAAVRACLEIDHEPDTMRSLIFLGLAAFETASTLHGDVPRWEASGSTAIAFKEICVLRTRLGSITQVGGGSLASRAEKAEALFELAGLSEEDSARLIDWGRGNWSYVAAGRVRPAIGSEAVSDTPPAPPA